MKRKKQLPVDNRLLPKGQQEGTFRRFFEYFLDHACICTSESCICQASTFRDLICEPILRNDKKYSREIEEILKYDNKRINNG